MINYSIYKELQRLGVDEVLHLTVTGKYTTLASCKHSVNLESEIMLEQLRLISDPLPANVLVLALRWYNLA